MSIQDISSVLGTDVSQIISRARLAKSLGDLLKFGEHVVLVSETGELFCAKKQEVDGVWSFVADKGAFHGTSYPEESMLIILKSKDPQYVSLSAVHAGGKLLRATADDGLQLQFISQYITTAEMWTIHGKSFHKCVLVNCKYPEKKFTVTIQRILSPPTSPLETNGFQVFLPSEGPSSPTSTQTGSPRESSHRDLQNPDPVRLRVKFLEKRLEESNQMRKVLEAQVASLRGRLEPGPDSKQGSSMDQSQEFLFYARKLETLEDHYEKELEEREKLWGENLAKLKEEMRREYVENFEVKVLELGEASGARSTEILGQEIEKLKLEFEVKLRKEMEEIREVELANLEREVSKKVEGQREALRIEIVGELEGEFRERMGVEKREIEGKFERQFEERIEALKEEAVAKERVKWEEKLTNQRREIEASVGKKVGEKMNRLEQISKELEGHLGELEKGKSPEIGGKRVSESEWKLRVAEGQVAAANSRADELAASLRTAEVAIASLEERLSSQRAKLEGKVKELERELTKLKEERIQREREGEATVKELNLLKRENREKNERAKGVIELERRVKEAENGRKVWEQKSKLTAERLLVAEEKNLGLEKLVLELETRVQGLEFVKEEALKWAEKLREAEGKAETAEIRVQGLEKSLERFKKEAEEREREMIEKGFIRVQKMRAETEGAMEKVKLANEEKEKAEKIMKQMEVLVIETERQRQKLEENFKRMRGEIPLEKGEEKEREVGKMVEKQENEKETKEDKIERDSEKPTSGEIPPESPPGTSGELGSQDSSTEVTSKVETSSGEKSTEMENEKCVDELTLDPQSEVPFQERRKKEGEISQKLLALILFGIFIILFKLGLSSHNSVKDL